MKFLAILALLGQHYGPNIWASVHSESKIELQLLYFYREPNLQLTFVRCLFDCCIDFHAKMQFYGV